MAGAEPRGRCHAKCHDNLNARLEGFMEARVTSHSQSFRIRERMAEANVSHGPQIRADLPNIRVLELAGDGESQGVFCGLGPLRVRDVMHTVDDLPLPWYVG